MSDSGRPKVLIVDDEAIIALDLKQRLEAKGFEVPGTWDNAEDAIATTGSLVPDLVLMDINLVGDRDGIDAAHEIRTRFGTPVIFLTAYSDEVTLRRAKSAQPYAFLVKPIDDAQLSIAAELAITRHQSHLLLARRALQQSVVAEIGQAALGGGSMEELLRLAEAKINEALRGACCRGVEISLFDEKPSGTFRSNSDYEEGVSVAMTGPNGPVGAITVCPERGRALTSDDLGFLSAVAGVVGLSQQRKKFERELELERERLEERVKERTEELTRLNRALSTSNQELERFAYLSSHDLKEPLRTVSIYVQFLERTLKGESATEAREYMAFILTGVKRMHALIEGIMTYSSLRTQPMTLLPVNCSEVFEHVRQDLAAAIAESGARIDCGALPTVRGDAVRIGQLLQNLLSNAIKFRRKEEPPEVRIRAERQGAEWLFEVRDNGIGIDEKYRSYVFEMFRRLEHSDKYPGAGIGLAVCRKIVDQHGGRLWLESELGKGTSFFFTLPEA